MQILAKQSGLVCAALFILTCCCSPATAQNNLRASNDYPSGSLSEIKPDGKALLVVLKSSVISVEQTDQSIIELVLNADPEPNGRHQQAYGTLAKKLNSYIRKYRSLSAADYLGEADFIIFFSLIEYRHILNTTYPFGELYVILKGESRNRRPPRIAWKSRKVVWAGDAIDEFLRDLKNTRGEP